MEGHRRVEVVVLAAFFMSSFFTLPMLAYCHNLNLGKSSASQSQTSSCGKIQNISCPFHLKDDGRNCSNSTKKQYELTCQANKVYFGSMEYYVENIFYENQTLQLVDPQLSTSMCPNKQRNHRLSPQNISSNENFLGLHLAGTTTVAFMNCSSPVKDESCIPFTCARGIQGSFYFHVGENLLSELPPGCYCYAMVPIINQESMNIRSVDGIQKLLQMGFGLSWLLKGSPSETPQGNPIQTYYMTASFSSGWSLAIDYTIIVRTSLGLLHLIAVIIFVIYRKRKSSFGKRQFPYKHESLGPCSFSYSEVKKMTQSFKEKLGQGGFGSVFKGRLPNGQLVAVKMLDSSKANGEEFINEVATIGTIHHVNVVQLIGFCSEESKTALVYEFMPNGSLEKYIFSSDKRSQMISWEKLYEIALGVAYGIEYLHRGCNVRILHFDIKPHNILLDHCFNPKISDFGMAKLFSTEYSLVSMSNARGTAGYIAPELFSANFGGVSFKSDVYSYGMLLLEMAGRRKNFNPLVERASQIYFPTWVHDHLTLEDLEIGTSTKAEEDIAKKLVIIGLWCIQMNPNNRPSMSRVVEMLEGNISNLEMPPKPFLASPERRPIEDLSLTESDSEALLFTHK